MGDQSEPSRLRVLFEAALQDYEKQAGISLAKHPLAERLQNCDSIESVAAVLREQTQTFSEFRGKEKVLKPLKTVLSVLYNLSALTNFGQDIGLQFPPVKAIHTGIAVLLSAVRGSIDSYDALVDLLELIENFLNRLDIYTKVPPTAAMTETVVKILVELLSTLALATKHIKQGRPKKLVKKLFGEKDFEAVVLQRLDRLTQDEARITAAQTLEIVYGLIQNVRVVMDDGKASIDHVKDTLEIMQQVASDLNKSKRDNLQRDIFRWLSPPDPWKTHHIACDSRHRGSATWFIQSNTFSEWKASEAPSPVLWVHGKPGAGKSVFCSTIIEEVDVMRKVGLASLAFFYFDFREDERIGLRGLLSSLLAQLCHQNDPYCDILSKLYSEYANGLRHPSDDALAGCLKDLLKFPGLAPVYLIVDALDECPNDTPSLRSHRARVLTVIEELIISQFQNLRICVTSRPETDIKDVLDPLILRSVSLHDQSEQKRDIEDFIKFVINTHPKNRRWRAEHKKLAIDALSQKADGMFRWVVCQADYICGCVPAHIQSALADLPKTLDETYQRSLREINEAHWEFAHRLFQFVAVASRPLCVKELAELFAFDFMAGPIPIFHEDWRLEDPVDAVLSTCSSLLTIVNYQGGRYRNTTVKVIQFSHFSVKEFLTSARLAEASDITPRRYHVSMTPAHTLAAQACLGALLHLDKNVVTGDSLGKWPLIEYAAEHLLGHVRFRDVSRNVEDGMKQLFHPSKPHLAVWIWIHGSDPIIPSRLIRRPQRPSPPLGTSLHYAALWGLHSIVESLIIEHSQNVDSKLRSQDLTVGVTTPLHLASEHGHVKTARILIENGADVMAQAMSGVTPLHLASREWQVEVARMLIERGADPTAQNGNGETPLHLAFNASLYQRSGERQVEVARVLIERGADLMAQKKDGATPLHQASICGSVECVHMLIERGADVMAHDKDGGTPLHMASLLGRVEVARMLIERGADPTAQNKDDQSPLHLAFTLLPGQAEVARILIEQGADLTAQDKDGQTPLHLALTRDDPEWAEMMPELILGQIQVARMLIERGADLTAQNKDGQTPLHLALKERQEEVTRMLIERGVDMTTQNKDGETPLYLALCCGQVEVARTHIERGADVTAQTKDGWTLFQVALLRGQVDIACMLINRGADLTAQNKDGKAPLHLALTPSSFRPILDQGKVDLARMLIERGVDVTAQTKDGETPLHMASRVGQVEVTRMLIERGADATSKNKAGETPFDLALTIPSEFLKEGHTEVVRMLIEHGADPTAQNKDGESLLHLASREGRAEVACMLIDRGADVTAQNKDGETPLHLASRGDHVGIVHTLLERGADVNAKNKNGLTPYNLACQRDLGEVNRILLLYDADPGAPESMYSTNDPSSFSN